MEYSFVHGAKELGDNILKSGAKNDRPRGQARSVSNPKKYNLKIGEKKKSSSSQQRSEKNVKRDVFRFELPLVFFFVSLRDFKSKRSKNRPHMSNYFPCSKDRASKLELIRKTKQADRDYYHSDRYKIAYTPQESLGSEPSFSLISGRRADSNLPNYGPRLRQNSVT